MPINKDLQRRTQWLWCLRHVTAITAGIALALATSSTAAATDDVPEPLAEAVCASLDAWSQFATTGDLSALGSSFAPDGPQWRQFEAEYATRQGATSAEPLRLELREHRFRLISPNTATVWARVEASRSGYESEVFGWDFDLIRDNGRWRVWTVVEAVEPSSNTQERAPVPTVTATTRTTVPVTEPEIGADHLAEAASGSSPGTRVPAVSAWIVVITLVGVALAGYMAPRIDRRGEG